MESVAPSKFLFLIIGIFRRHSKYSTPFALQKIPPEGTTKMRINCFLPFFVAPVFSQLRARDGKSIVDALSTISDQLKTMDSTLDKISGGGSLDAAVEFQGQATELGKEIETATGAAKDSAALSDEESSSVAYAVVDLTDGIYSVLDKTALKRGIFDKITVDDKPVTGLVKTELQNLQNATDVFGATLTDKFVKDIKNVAPLLVSAIDFHFYEAIQAYA